MKTFAGFLLLVLFLSPQTLPAEDWPQWRGADRTDVSTETGLLKEWPKGGPKRLWLFRKAGLGYSGFSVVEGRLFTMGARDGTSYILCLDAERGTETWVAAVGKVFDDKSKWGDGPRATPTVDEDRVYAMGAKGDLLCARVEDGSEVWKVSMVDLGGDGGGWGYTESVLVDGKQVVCTPGGRKGAMAALDKMTGKVIWRATEFTDEAQYSSIVACEIHGIRQYVQLTKKHLVGVEAATGRLLWQSGWSGRIAVIPTPIPAEQYVYISSGYGVGCKLVKVGAGNRVRDVWRNRTMKNHHGGVIKVGDHVYGHSDGPGWVCQEYKTGEMVWNEKGELGKGAIACADGNFYCVEQDTGTVVLIDVSPAGWQERGRFKLDPQTELRKPDGRIWTHPVISNGRLYLRDQELLYCYDVRAK